MERLPAHLQIKICKYLDGTGSVNVCEALPSLNSVLRSLSVKGILRSYVRKMEWVDARLCCMLYSTLAVVEREAESMAEAESEAEVLYRAIRYYQDCCRFPPMHITHEVPNHGKSILFLILALSITDLDLSMPFQRTLEERKFGANRN